MLYNKHCFIMKHILSLTLALAFLIISSSCLTQRHTVGDGPIGSKGTVKVYDKHKDRYLFWGLLPLNQNSIKTPEHGNYQVKTCFNFEDALLSLVSIGIVSHRTTKILEYKQEKISGVDFKVGDKIVTTIKRQKVIGEIVGVDAKQRKISFVYSNVYGEKKVKTSKYTLLNGVTEQEYLNRKKKWDTKIARSKYKVGDYAIWPMNKSMEFGVIVKLDNKTHKATIELSNIFSEVVIFKVPYLDITLIDSYDYQSRLEDWEAVKQDYVFDIGESVKWNYSSTKTRECKVLSINNSSHVAEVKYWDEKGEERVSRVGYLKLTKI